MATKQVPIRLNLDNEDEAKAYEYLQSMDKTIYTSYTKVFTAAIINLFEDKPEHMPDPTITNTNTDNNNCSTAEIVSAIKDEVSNVLPELVAATLMKLMQLGGEAINNLETASVKTINEEPGPQLSEDAWDFIAGLNR